MNIEFAKVIECIDEYRPKPASDFLPQWYKDTESYINGKKVVRTDGYGMATVKKCVPVFDVLTAGYIITTYVDIYVQVVDGEQVFSWPNSEPIKFHPIEQAPKHPAAKPYAYPKFLNPWAIRTPKGYSCLFVQPVHRSEPFTVLPGIVDTDSYTDAVHFPFVINDPNWEGLIPAGTPIAQVIPFKRDSWKMKFDIKKHIESALHTREIKRSKFYDIYRNTFWNRKSFK